MVKGPDEEDHHHGVSGGWAAAQVSLFVAPGGTWVWRGR